MPDTTRKLLIVEDDPGIQSQLRWCFEDYDVIAATDRQSAINELRRHEPPVVLQDLGLPPDDEGVGEGFATLREILQLAPFTKVIVVTGHGDQSNALRAVGLGAYDFYQKPVDVDTLQLIVQRAYQIHTLEAENRRLGEALGASPLDGVIVACEAMMKVCRTIEKVAPTNATTLLQGESGTGKEVLAHAIHQLSPRANKPFVAINCAAIPENLLESELFGFEKGAFTGAVKQTPGKIEVADSGTLFLDEIGDMPLSLQARLLRVLDDRMVTPLGTDEARPVDFLLISASHRCLQDMVAEGSFREDLYYRLAGIELSLPALRDRSDRAELIGNLLRELGRTDGGVTPAAWDLLMGHPWPGNVRQLHHVLRSAVALSDGAPLTPEHLPSIGGATAATAVAGSSHDEDVSTLSPELLKERQVLRDQLEAQRWNVSHVAKSLGISRNTLYRRMHKLCIPVTQSA